jgi:hypothetical protein
MRKSMRVRSIIRISVGRDIPQNLCGLGCGELNGKLGLISTAGGNYHLILMQRTTRTFNAAGTLEPTAGGVVELPVAGDRRDADEFGAVDFIRGIRREVSEELGLTSADYNIAAHRVFLSNNRPKPQWHTSLDTGEVVATVLAMGTTPLCPETIAGKRFLESPSKGLYESRGLVYSPMGTSAKEFFDIIEEGYYSKEGLAWLGNARSLRGDEAAMRLMDEIKQPTLLSMVYASAMIHGAKETVDCLESLRSAPWWTRPWPDRPSGAQSRVCRDPSWVSSS